MRRTAGFTLIELIVVVAIIGVLVVIAFANMRGGKKAANEANTIAFFKQAVISGEQYRVRFGKYAATFPDLVQSEYFADGQNPSGYNLAFIPGVDRWAFQGSPKEVGETGDRYFYVDQTGVIRAAPSGPADSTSTPID